MGYPSELEKPVFIVGPERSGTTLIYSLLANANEVYWFSRIDSRMPSFPFVAELNRRFFRLFERDPYIASYGGVSMINGVDIPSECNPYWRRFFGVGGDEYERNKNDRESASEPAEPWTLHYYA